ncbi:hypothetical protein [Agromyces aerolatus]|uniref:hypothetical protein n=1 Tax=Agromyces sp. LY-1074 TaxID=3074080 RepID=UPI00285EDCA2|nr:MULTISPECIES: hypothetical protein [unclassified Agromyces]MDR5699284.1 hypothetical protein [Agromyces sp. LY-1074]MDR5705580.1 hypothetical protein [Agromyces sp. LY-1358]
MPVRRRARVVWTVAISVTVVGLLAAAAAIVVPWVIAETEARPADGLEAVVLGAGDEAVAFTPANGWLVHPRFASDSTIDLVAPDQALTIELELVPDAPDAALDHLIEAAADTPVGEHRDGGVDPRTERLASGLELRHVPTEHGLLAVVAAPSGSVAVTVRAGRSVELADYRTALAELLETVRAD